MKCEKRFGHAAQNVCGGDMIVIASGIVRVHYCVVCSNATLRCTECSGNLRRLIQSLTFKCETCTREFPILMSRESIVA